MSLFIFKLGIEKSIYMKILFLIWIKNCEKSSRNSFKLLCLCASATAATNRPLATCRNHRRRSQAPLVPLIALTRWLHGGRMMVTSTFHAVNSSKFKASRRVARWDSPREIAKKNEFVKWHRDNKSVCRLHRFVTFPDTAIVFYRTYSLAQKSIRIV